MDSPIGKVFHAKYWTYCMIWQLKLKAKLMFWEQVWQKVDVIELKIYSNWLSAFTACHDLRNKFYLLQDLTKHHLQEQALVSKSGPQFYISRVTISKHAADTSTTIILLFLN